MSLTQSVRIIRIYWFQCQTRQLDGLLTFTVGGTIITGDFNAVKTKRNSPMTDKRAAELKMWIERNRSAYVLTTTCSSKRLQRHIDLTFLNVDDIQRRTMHFGTNDHWSLVIDCSLIGYDTNSNFPHVYWKEYEIILAF